MVYLLGCDHYLQNYDLNGEVQEIERDLKQTFYSTIEEIVRTHRIEFIGEECKPAQKTIAAVLDH